ncbi:MAG: amidophosphoribosyltransferase [Clostridiaceae bacterium]|nr:amidophosphoribosyltransferase [Clostridiaceae bacterium]
MSGIVGVSTDKSVVAAHPIIYGVYALQHRGQVNTGVALLDNNQLVVRKGSGQINALFPDNISMNIPGDRGLGHVKYGEYLQYDIEQPILPKEYKINGTNCLITIDGNILNKDFSLHDLALALNSSLQTGKEYLSKLQGAFAGVYLDPYKMIGFRDPVGLKPLYAGKFDHGYILASETCAIDSTGADLIQSVDNGEMVVIQKDKIDFYRYTEKLPKKKCIFELVYISRPDSYFDGLSVYQARSQMGKILYEEYPTSADIVMGAPDSGLIAAVGYAEESKIPYKDGIIKNRYVGRTFLTTDESERKTDIFIKFNPIKEVLRDKEIVLVDDSIIKGSTIKRTIKMLRNAGAKKIHVRISSPILRFPCNLSMDIPNVNDLMAHQKDVEEIRQEINADSLYYLSMEGLLKACGQDDFCDHCFTNNYPIKPYEEGLWV